MRGMSIAPFNPSLPVALIWLGLWSAALAQTADPGIEYLVDHPELVISSSQDWGELGWNSAAHQSGLKGAPLAIASRNFTKGLGHHANGSLTVLLDGEYQTFQAMVGLQPCAAGGSVIFRAFVDGQRVFDSGVMLTTNTATPVRLDLNGASELRLKANDAGDGITCDMANWADARLTRAADVAKRSVEPGVDIAPFGRVVTWDPSRMDGARANRIQEYRSEDIYLERPLRKDHGGAYLLPVGSNGSGCIGLQWLNRRAVKRLQIFFDRESALPSPDKVQVQGWFGESAWQGSWKRLEGRINASRDCLEFILDGAGAIQTQKIRWVFPSTATTRIRTLAAYTRSRWEAVGLVLESDKQHAPARAEIRIINGEFLSENEPGGRRHRGPEKIHWNTAKALELHVRSSRPSTLKSDPTVIQIRLPAGAFGVAIEDLRTQACVYVPDFGVSVARSPAAFSLGDYRERIAGKKTVLQQVRELPDQTMRQAMAETHHDAQKQGPVLLSLSCDNLKYVLDRDGTLHFPDRLEPELEWFANAGELHPTFGTGKTTGFKRQLDGGWLPIPVITLEENGVVCRQRTFVVPLSKELRLGQPSICVLEFTVTNTTSRQADASIELKWLQNARTKAPVVVPVMGSAFRLGDAGLYAMLLKPETNPLQLRTEAGSISLNGQLPAEGQGRLVVLLSNAPIPPCNAEEVSRWRSDTQRYWESILEAATQITTPDSLLDNIIRSSQVRCLIAARNEQGGRRIAPWIAAMSYGPLESEANSVIRGMDYLGHADFARRAFDFFIERYNTNGFLTTGYTTFGTAWHLWTLSEHCQLHKDREWLAQRAPELVRVGDWIVRQTGKTKVAGSPGRSAVGFSERDDGRPPEYGLMPPGVLADWNAFACHYTMNAYYYAALRGLASLLPELGNPAWTAKAEVFAKAARELRENILLAYRWTQSQAPVLLLRDGTWIPHYPSQVHSPGKLADFFPGQDAGRSWCYDVELGAHQLVPTAVLEPSDREVTRMLNHMEDEQFLADGWFDYPASMNQADCFDLGGFSKVQPYYTRNCEVYALRDEVKPFTRSYFNTVAAMLNPEVLTFWEHFNHSGAWDKTHETGYFLHQTRTMLLTERGRELWLAPLVTSNWFGDAMTLSVSNAPTRFGVVSYRIDSHLAQGHIDVSVNARQRLTAERIVLRLRHPGGMPIRYVELNSTRLRISDKQLIRLKSTAEPVRLRVFY